MGLLYFWHTDVCGDVVILNNYCHDLSAGPGLNSDLLTSHQLSASCNCLSLFSRSTLGTVTISVKQNCARVMAKVISWVCTNMNFLCWLPTRAILDLILGAVLVETVPAYPCISGPYDSGIGLCFAVTKGPYIQMHCEVLYWWTLSRWLYWCSCSPYTRKKFIETAPPWYRYLNA